MAQAETILQHRIDCLDRKLTAKRIAAASWSGAGSRSPFRMMRKPERLLPASS